MKKKYFFQCTFEVTYSLVSWFIIYKYEFQYNVKLIIKFQESYTYERKELALKIMNKNKLNSTDRRKLKFQNRTQMTADTTGINQTKGGEAA